MCRQYGTYIRMCAETKRHGQRVDAETAIWNEKGIHVLWGGEPLPLPKRVRRPRLCSVCGETRISTHVTVCNGCEAKQREAATNLRAVGIYQNGKLMGIEIVEATK